MLRQLICAYTCKYLIYICNINFVSEYVHLHMCMSSFTDMIRVLCAVSRQRCEYWYYIHKLYYCIKIESISFGVYSNK